MKFPASIFQDFKEKLWRQEESFKMNGKISTLLKCGFDQQLLIKLSECIIA